MPYDSLQDSSYSFSWSVNDASSGNEYGQERQELMVNQALPPQALGTITQQKVSTT